MEWKIDELAQRAGTTTRNVRAYQTRGLIPPPRLVGRTGYYNEEHLRRLELIGHLQERGFSLAAIRQTLDAWSQGGDLAHLIGLHHLLTAPYTDEQPVRMTPEQLVERFPEAAGHPELFDRAMELGLIVPEGNAFMVPSPTMIEAGSALARSGVPLAEIYDLVVAVRADVDDIAQRFVDLVGRHIVEPVAEGQVAPEDVASVSASLEQLRPIALEVVRPFLAQAMRRVTDERLRAFGSKLNQEAPETQ
ncbi:MAG TPA: MerR family transcriptional regulator [Egibacteraceae bacterium]|nr:MerR family transcriptional regulator [Egibacteraceae bacterium]